MKLICEDIQDVKYLVEEKDGKKSIHIEGTFLQGAIKNRNNRLYPMSILEREVGRYVNEYVGKNRAYGELGHPRGPTINLDRVSHMIKELYQDGNNFVGRAKILGTPMGNIAANLIQEGATLGVSSRGIGSLKPDKHLGCDIVQDDFKLAVGADIVADPSAPDAFVRGVMESAEWLYNESTGQWSTEAIDRVIQEVKKDPQNSVRVAEQFERFLNILSEGAEIKARAIRSGVRLSDAEALFWETKKAAAKIGRANDYEYIHGAFGRAIDTSGRR